MLAVFSDVDETVIRGKSLLTFGEELAAAASDGVQVQAALERVTRLLHDGAPRAEANRAYYRLLLAGRAAADIAFVARRWFLRQSADPLFFRESVCAFLQRAHHEGARIVLVSGSFPELIAPIAERTHAVDVLAAPVEQLDGHYTGELLGEPAIGEGKALAVRRYAEQHGLALDRCAGIGDDLTDVPFLSLLGAPLVPASAGPAMLRHAQEAGWALL